MFTASQTTTSAADIRIRNTVIALALSLCAGAQAGEPRHRDGAVRLSDMGTFYVGGREVASPAPASAGPAFILPPVMGSTVVDQSFVEYFVPAKRPAHTAPIVMVPGGSLLGSQFQTTPDGRPGWNTRFLQWGYPTYLLEPANRGRSGFYMDDLNARLLAAQAPPVPATGLWHFVGEVGWPQFGLGTIVMGQLDPFVPTTFIAHPTGRFPAAARKQLFASFVPNRFGNPQAEVNGIVELLQRTGPAVLLGHSLGGQQVFQAALLAPDRVKAIVVIEPVACPGETANPPFTAANTAALVAARIPVLVVYGDFISGGSPQQGYRPFQDARRTVCRSFTTLLAAKGIRAEVISLPEDKGIQGNSHLMMMEDNSDEIAALIESWLRRR